VETAGASAALVRHQFGRMRSKVLVSSELGLRNSSILGPPLLFECGVAVIK